MFFSPTVSDQTNFSKVEGNPRTILISVKINRVKCSIGGYADSCHVQYTYTVVIYYFIQTTNEHPNWEIPI
jgi:hypothetical protein